MVSSGYVGKIQEDRLRGGFQQFEQLIDSTLASETPGEASLPSHV